jgi:crossover junction endodeoxyribonuclease RuvC
MPRENRRRFNLRVLGIDPAAAGATGFAVVDADGANCCAVHYGAVPAVNRSDAGDIPARLRHIHAQIAELIERFSPDAVAIESIFAALNIKTALRLAEVRGVILLAAAQSGLSAHSYSPREVKAAVTGYGQAGKEQIQQIVRALLSLKEIPQPADAADALAVALCHIQFSRNVDRFGPAAALMAAPGTSRRASASPSRAISVR